jgi:hypothetical protein
MTQFDHRTSAKLRLTGTKNEIGVLLSSLLGAGFRWKTNGKFYPQRDSTTEFSYYLNDVCVLSQSVDVDSQLQPRAGDMVLGGNNSPQHSHTLPPHTPH